MKGGQQTERASVMVKTVSKEEVQPVPPGKNSVRMHGVPGSREERLKGGHQEGQAPSLAVEEPFGWGGACCQSTLFENNVFTDLIVSQVEHFTLPRPSILRDFTTGTPGPRFSMRWHFG